MKRTYFLLQLKLFFNNPKNIGLFIISAIVALYFGLVSAPNHHIIEKIDQPAIQAELDDHQAFIKIADKEFQRSANNPNAMPPSKGAKEAKRTYPTIIKLDKLRLQALNNNNYRAYASFSWQWYHYLDSLLFQKAIQNYTYPSEYYSQTNYPGYDGHYGYSRITALYKGLSQGKTSVNKDILEERTSLQILQKSLSGWSVILLIIFVCLFTCDLLTYDQKFRTILKNIPLTKTFQLGTKLVVAFIGIIFNFLISFLIIILCTAPRYGLGSLSLAVPIYRGRPYYEFSFKTISLGRYFVYFSMMALLVILIFISLSILISLLIKNSYITAILTIIVAVIAKVSYFSLGMGYVYPWLRYLPTTYFTIGDSLSGYLSYLMGTPGWGFQWGLMPLLVLLIGLNLLLLIFSNSRRFSII
ncbi:hypothetical protein J2Z60_002119 [Lactobacillus colini]|uniref:ABC transporter permease n=1 Tax=Lactobacillus colini TaxID=1819254 RepID=A0ABS4MGV0_9LACO|nr:tellurium resistance protein TerC [Lactobacillus colini]MBP2058928.1 hypothetical protein [Lactobacillus colini]